MPLRCGVDADRALLRGLHVENVPVPVQPAREAGTVAQQRIGVRAPRTHADHDLIRAHAFAGGVLPLPGLFAEPGIELGGDFPERQLAELLQIAVLEEVRKCRIDPFFGVDASGADTLAQVVDRNVDVDDLVGPGYDPVRNPLPDFDGGGFLNDLVETLKVLDVQRRNHMDSGIEQLFDILIALRVLRTGHVRQPARPAVSGRESPEHPFPRARCRDAQPPGAE